MKAIAMKVIKVVPEHGYGWQRSGEPIDVPRPFDVERDLYVSADDQQSYRWLVGAISESHHAWNGLWVLVTLRVKGAPSAYNVYVYEKKPPVYRGKDVDPFSVPRVASGFATLEA